MDRQGESQDKTGKTLPLERSARDRRSAKGFAKKGIGG